MESSLSSKGQSLPSEEDRLPGTAHVPSTLRRATGTHQQDLDNRFGYLRECAKEFNVNGAILYVIRFCDTFEYDSPEVRDYLEEAGIAVLHLGDDYSLSSIQGFLEMIG